MTSTTLTSSDLQRLKSDPRFTAAHAALLDLMIRAGEVVVETAAPLTQPATAQGVQA